MDEGTENEALRTRVRVLEAEKRALEAKLAETLLRADGIQRESNRVGREQPKCESFSKPERQDTDEPPGDEPAPDGAAGGAADAALATRPPSTPILLVGFMQRILGYSMTLFFMFVPLLWALATLRSYERDARGVPMPLCGGLVATNLMLAFSSLYAYYISYVAVCFGWRHALRNVALPSAPFVLAALAFAAFGRCARQNFAEHFFGSNALHCTATARMLIPAECSAVP